MKKYFALLLCVLFAFTLLCACGETKNNPDNPKDPVKSSGESTDEGTGDAVLDAAVAKFRNTNEEFSFGASFIDKNRRDFTDEELEAEGGASSTTSVQQEAMMNRVLDVEKKYGVKVMMTGGSSLWLMTASELAAKVAEGEEKIDIFHTEIRQGRDLFLGGALVPMSELHAIDLSDSEKWGSGATLQAVTYRDVVWGSPWHGSSYMAFPVFFDNALLYNSEAFEAAEVDYTVQELVDSKDWTFDKYLEVVQDVDADEDIGEFYGMGYEGNLGMACVYANGGSLVLWDEEAQKYVFGMTKTNAQNGLAFYRDLLSLDGYVLQSNSIDQLAAGHFVFFMSGGNNIFGHIAGTTTLAWAPFPYGPDAEYGKVVSSEFKQQESVCVFFKQADNDRVQMSGLLFDEIVAPLTDAFNGGDYDSWLYHNYFLEGDEFSFSVYKDYAIGRHWNYGAEFTSTSSGDLFAALNTQVSMVGIGKKTPEKAMGSIEAAYNTEIDNLFN